MAVNTEKVIRITFLFLLLLTSNLAVADEARPVALEEKRLSADNTDHTDPSSLIKLAEVYLYQEPIEARELALRALSLISRDEKLQAQASRLVGMANMYLGKNDAAFMFLARALDAAEAANDAHLLSVSHRSIGVYYELIVDYDNAVKYYIEAIKFGKLSNNVTDLAMVYNNLGNVLNSQGDYAEAAEYFEQAVAIHKNTDNHEMAMNASVGLGVSYLKLHYYDKALKLFKSILVDGNQIYDFTYSEASVNLAHVYQALSRHDEAIATYKHVIEDPRGGSYPQALAAAYLGLAKLYTTLGQFNEAISLYRKGIDKVKNKTSVESEIELYENLALLELKLGFYEEAAKTQAEYIARRNTIQPVIQAGMIKELEDKLTSQQELTSLQETLLQREREAKRASLFLFMAVVISLLCAVLFLTLRLRQQKLLRLEQANASLLIASETDPLTGIGNRRFLDRRLMAMGSDHGKLAFLLLDVDHFKELNDTYGHDVGDDILVLLAGRLKGLCRKADAIARIGGEEFVILLADSNEADSLQFAERLRSDVADIVTPSGARTTVSIGVAVGDTNTANYDVLYKQADIALYQAKAEGRNCVRMHT